MWLQNKFLELFKKPIKKNQDEENNPAGKDNSTPDIFDGKNLENINKEEK